MRREEPKTGMVPSKSPFIHPLKYMIGKLNAFVAYLKNQPAVHPTTHDIIKIFRETGEISMRKGQSLKNFVGYPWSSGPQTTLHHSLACFCH